jgi:hypothetical protein
VDDPFVEVALSHIVARNLFLSTRLSDEEMAELDATAEQIGMRKSDLVRVLIRDGLRAGVQPPQRKPPAA